MYENKVYNSLCIEAIFNRNTHKINNNHVFWCRQ